MIAPESTLKRMHSLRSEAPALDARRMESGLPRARNGLCSNCDLRLECTFPASEGGVWHCEEYA